MLQVYVLVMQSSAGCSQGGASKFVQGRHGTRAAAHIWTQNRAKFFALLPAVGESPKNAHIVQISVETALVNMF
jgi:hypothetical protein